jgi:hypothetical protein
MSKRGLLAAGLLGLCAIVAATSSTAAVRGAAIDVGKTVLLAPRTKVSGCRLGANPDWACSPGAYYSKLTKRVICAVAFRTGDVRNVAAVVEVRRRARVRTRAAPLWADA